MSKTVVILETFGPEYRVAVLDNSELLYLGINANTSKWIPNSQYIHEQFDKCRSVTDRPAAYVMATASSYLESLDLEGGIQHIDIWSKILYTDL